MQFMPNYAIPTDGDHLKVPSHIDVNFDWTYKDDSKDLLGLYAKGKQQQWDSDVRLDWDTEIDPDNPLATPDEFMPLFAADFYQKMGKTDQDLIRRHYQAWVISQFLHGEQGAMVCSARIVQDVPNLESKFYASTQVMDEARHVEVYRRFSEKIGLAYPITKPLQNLLHETITDRRWDITYLGMQVVIEGLALAAFAGIRDHSAEGSLSKSLTAYVMQDEARHVAFGRLALRDYYPHLSSYEKKEREDFLIEACWLMRDRFDSMEVWENLGLPMEECRKFQMESQGMAMFRSRLFSRIVPVVKDIGLWSPRVIETYQKMGVLGFEHTDITKLQQEDEDIARELDVRRTYVDNVIALAGE